MCATFSYAACDDIRACSPLRVFGTRTVGLNPRGDGSGVNVNVDPRPAIDVNRDQGPRERRAMSAQDKTQEPTPSSKDQRRNPIGPPMSTGRRARG